MITKMIPIILVYLLLSTLHAFEIQSLLDGVGSAFSSVQQSVSEFVNKETDDFAQIPLEIGDRLACTPCSLIAGYIMYNINDNTIVQSLMIGSCPAIFYGNWHKMWACEVLMVGAVVYSHFGASKSLCHAMGMCSNLFKVKRSLLQNQTPPQVDFNELVQLLPLDMDNFDTKLSQLGPAEYSKVKESVSRILTQRQNLKPVEFLETLREISKFYR
ncbi:unnamed protein product [Bursaphelenchus okinawaensis]|uniref:Saposin B-type domain-containing protein n=1 Tax=Bursaphelenchus okinawaensis TaxID=465554 RepID=A0A811K907_9BILA|nr:unnamed protein product [Bursaphelenchus okinawaensis]CAG9094403.1 unnamed protein product [Bursaphelenchus okinawaensis]